MRCEESRGFMTGKSEFQGRKLQEPNKTEKGHLKAVRVSGKFCLLPPEGRCGVSTLSVAPVQDLRRADHGVSARRCAAGCRGNKGLRALCGQ